MSKKPIEAAKEVQLLGAVDRWLEWEVKPVVKFHDHADSHLSKFVEQMKELGLFGATIGQQCGGLGLGDDLRSNHHQDFISLDGDNRNHQLTSDACVCDREIRN